MFNWSIAFRLMIRTFSLKRTSLRFITPRRLIVGLIVLPLFMVHIAINRLFMLLDWIFFPHFTNEKIDQPVFIIGVPRSATTYLLEVMSSDDRSFTSFRLWELCFAPSIIQKYFWCGIIAVDKRIGRPIYRLSKVYDHLILGKITKIHKTGMTQAEEDEMLLLYAFSSMYLTFLFPDVDVMEELVHFDQECPESKKEHIMKFYKRCVQRHLFVFGDSGRRKFLSKNPCFVSKVESVAETFPDAKLVYMLRSPYRTIPSTISMNTNVYTIFCNARYAESMHARTRDAVIRWYRHADVAMQSHWKNRHLVVRFEEITKQPESTLNNIYSFIGLSPDREMQELMRTEQEKVAEYSTTHKYNPGVGIDELLIKESLAGLNVGV